MRLFVIHNDSISDVIIEGISVGDVETILDSLSNKILIIFSTNTTGDPDNDFAQITRISAVAIDSDTGEELDSFNIEAALNASTVSGIGEQDRLVAAGKWEYGTPTIRDRLNASDYDISSYETGGSTSKSSEIEIALLFKTFVDKFVGRVVLISHNAQSDMWHINKILPDPIKNIHVVDTLRFTEKYFEPLLQVMVSKGSKKAAKMIDKIRSSSNISIYNLGHAVGIKHSNLETNEARKLGIIFSGMIEFIKNNLKYL